MEYLYNRWRILPSQDLSGVCCGGKTGLTSIVLPVRNNNKSIQNTLDSIHRQTYSDWELIVLDDGCNNHSREILDQYTFLDPRIRVVQQGDQRYGIGNVLLSISRGEFITWTNGENNFKNQFLELMVANLNKHPSCDMVLGDFNFLCRRRLVHLLGDPYLHWQQIEIFDYLMLGNELLRLCRIDSKKPILELKLKYPQNLRGDDRHQQERLLVWDDFRRDFCLMSSLWLLHSSQNPIVESLTKCFEEFIRSGGHILLSSDKELELPAFGLNTVWVRILAPGENIHEPPNGLPKGIMKALVTTGKPSQLTSYLEGWDIKLALESGWSHDKTEVSSWIYAPDAARLFTALDIAIRVHSLRRIEEHKAKRAGSLYKVTVVVCTHHFTPQLHRCLSSLATQNFPANDFEVLVVNNALPGSSAHPELKREIMTIGEEQFGRRFKQFRYIDCPLPGLSSARNAALVEARGEVIYFLDDDAVADPGWMSNLWNAFCAHPQAGVIGGPILLREPHPKPRWYRPAWQRFWSHRQLDFDEYKVVNSWVDYPWGANWAARRKSLLEIGGFRSRYGRRGTSLSGGEEIIAAALIQHLGSEIGFEPNAVVLHDPDPSRFRLSYLWRVSWANRKNWYRIQKEGYIPSELSPNHSFKRILNAFRQSGTDSLVKPFFTILAEVILQVWELIDFLKLVQKSMGRRGVID